MKLLGVITARANSSRLPGKVLQKIDSKTLLEFNDFDMALEKAESAIEEPAKLAKIVRGKIKMSMEEFSEAIKDFKDNVSHYAKHNNLRQ